MLALTRDDGQSISLVTSDGVVVVQLVWSKKGQARIGIQAPKSIAVNRTEIHDRILAEQGKAKS